MEEWKTIPDYNDYQVSNLGRVKSLKNKKERILIPQDCNSYDKHQKVTLSKNGKSKKFFVHRLVMITFNPVDNMNKLQVNHKDGNPLNNRLDNLEWVTETQNFEHYKNILIPQRRERNELHIGLKPTPIEVTFINGIKNYYLGQEELISDLNISRNTLARWKINPPQEIISIKNIKKLPENYHNSQIKIRKKSIPRQIIITFLDNTTKIFDNGYEADKYFNLSKGTILRWKKITKDKKPNKYNELKIKKIEVKED